MIFQLVIASKRQDSGSAKGLSVKGAPSKVVQLLSNSGIGVVLQQLIDEHKQLRWVPPSAAHCHRDCLGGSSFEAHLSGNHLLVLKQGHIFQQQTHHTFAIPIQGARVMPHPWKIVHQVCNGLLFEGGQSALFCGILSLGLLLDLRQLSQASIPVSF
jgi:hypothetical protein